MTGTPAVHVINYGAWCRKAISRLLKLSSGDIAEHDSATSLLRAIGKCQTALHRPRRKRAGDEAFKTQLDGYNFLPFLKGRCRRKTKEGVVLLRRRQLHLCGRLQTEAPLVMNDCVHFEQLCCCCCLGSLTFQAGTRSSMRNQTCAT
jgi:hypothetical protein